MAELNYTHRAATQRKNSSDRCLNNIRVLESSQPEYRRENRRCSNCKERHYLTEQPLDRNNLFCTNCGALTPLRSVRYDRGLAAPAIQQPAGQTGGIIQSQVEGGPRSRRPRGIHSNKAENPLVKQLSDRGMQIVDSQYIEPVPQESSY